MSDRLQEIRARLDAATTLPVSPHSVTLFPLDRKRDEKAERAFIAHAPADIAWLLAEVEAWHSHLRCCDCQRMRSGEVIGCECLKCKRYRAVGS